MKLKTIFLTLGLSILVQIAFSQEIKISDKNCAFTPPTGWIDITKKMERPGFAAVFTHPDRKAMVYLKIEDKAALPMDGNFVKNYEADPEQSGGTALVSGSFVEIEGLKSYRRVGKGLLNDKPITTLELMIPDKTRYYHMNSIDFEGNADKDPEILKSLSSFRFIKPLEKPSS